MNEEVTRNLPDDATGLILARLDSIDARLNSVDARLNNLEEKVEAHAYDTKPIWERALNEILETRAQVVKVEDRLGRVENEVKDMRRMFHHMFADLVRAHGDLVERLDKIEGSGKPS